MINQNKNLKQTKTGGQTMQCVRSLRVRPNCWADDSFFVGMFLFSFWVGF